MKKDTKNTNNEWETLARLDPLWAILTDKNKRFGKWNEDEFFDTGKEEIDKTLSHLKKTGLFFTNHKQIALDFGCGTGRLTRALSKHFPKVYGIDISKTMIKMAKKLNADYENCFFIKFTPKPPLIFPDNTIDFIYSNLVLQHLPNKAAVFSVISDFIRILKSSGVAYFQLPSRLPLLSKLQIRRKIFFTLKQLGFKEKFLYYTLGLYSFSMLSMTIREIENIIIKNGGKILEIKNPESNNTIYVIKRDSKKRVLMPIIKGGGGFEVYQNLLSDVMKSRGYSVKVKYFSEIFSFFPQLINVFYRPLIKYDLIHTIPDYGFVFKNWGRKLLLTNHHLVFDGNYLEKCHLVKRLYYCLLLKRYFKLSIEHAQGIVSVSRYSKRIFEHFFKGVKTHLIYNGIDTQKFKPVKTDRKDNKVRLLFVGNLIKRKGADLLPKIMGKIGENYELFYTSGLRTNRKFTQRNMHPLGKLDETRLVEEYNKCDIFLFPTRLEGFGLAVAEAMACGKPVITTNCSSMPELIINGRGGFLCQSDNVGGFAGKIAFLARHIELRKKMGKFNRKRILENFTLETMGKKYDDLYKKLVK